ncbi:hypothetical protein F5X98DRAFT_390098 [Xylaria grammica]|nr:hypothetical protein F5X98DRAFT_390098 [Xylaria grammica]
MPRHEGHGRRAPPISVDFKFLMNQIQRKLKAEGRGRDRVFYREVKRQFAKFVMTQQPRANPHSLFVWNLFEGVSNYFWPGSVTPADRPLGMQSSRPYVNVCEFRSLDIDSVSYEQLIDFIQYNSQTSFRLPRRSASRTRRQGPRRRKRERLREERRRGSSMLNPIVLSPLPGRMLSPTGAKYVTNNGLEAQSIWDDDVEMTGVSPQTDIYTVGFTKPQIPTLSFACRPGWDSNKKRTQIPGGGRESIFPYKPIAYWPFDVAQPAPLGNASFTRAPEKDVQAFLDKFLGRGED